MLIRVFQGNLFASTRGFRNLNRPRVQAHFRHVAASPCARETRAKQGKISQNLASVKYARRADGASSGSSFLWACGRGASATSCCTLAATSIYEGLASTASRRRRGDNLISYPRVCRHASSICRRTRREARRAALVDRRHRLQHAAIDSAALGSRRHRCGCRHPHHHRCERSSSSSSLPKQTAKQRSGPAASAS